ncbi:MAG: hypothetical protein MJ152_01465, partial [Clostridia bacterium]|nr:hypothetical protein [Clostridia bacterium]
VAQDSLLYDGYMDGEFLTESEIETNLATLVGNVAKMVHRNITELIVGVPSEFCKCVCKRISRKFLSNHKIKQADIDELVEANADFGDSEEYAVINHAPMQFVLDDNINTLKPVGLKSNSLVMDISYVLAKKSFIDFMLEKFANIGVLKADFVSTTLGQAMNCALEYDLTKPFALVDVGHISTSVCVYKGAGLALLSSFSMGGGHVSSDISQVLHISFKDAELLKRKVVLTVTSDRNENYEICKKDSMIQTPINMTNQIVKSRIERIASIVDEILSVDEVFKAVNIYITGDGIANFRGAKSIMRGVTKRDVYDFKNQFDNSRNKFQTAVNGLIAVADAER